MLHQGTTTGTERSSALGGRREEKARSEHIAAERSMPVRQPLLTASHYSKTQHTIIILTALVSGVSSKF